MSTDDGAHMITTADARALIDELFEQEGLIIGGLVALHDIEDEVIWRLMRSLDAIRRKTLRRLAEQGAAPTDEVAADQVDLTPHPAIEHFLQSVRTG